MHGLQEPRVDERPEAAGRPHDDLAGRLPEALGVPREGEAADERRAGERLGGRAGGTRNTVFSCANRAAMFSGGRGEEGVWKGRVWAKGWAARAALLGHLGKLREERGDHSLGLEGELARGLEDERLSAAERGASDGHSMYGSAVRDGAGWNEARRLSCTPEGGA